MKKLASVLICAMLLIGLLPTSIFADGENHMNVDVGDWYVGVRPGDSATFYVDVTADDYSQVHYQWVEWGWDGQHSYRVPLDIEGATSYWYTTEPIYQAYEIVNDYKYSYQWACKIWGGTIDGVTYTEESPYWTNSGSNPMYTVYINNEFRLEPADGYGSYYGLRLGDSLTMAARVTGYDLEDMTWLGWYRGDSFPYDPNTWEAIEDGETNSLTIESITADDVGCYVCRAEDRYGTIAMVYFTVQNNFRVWLDESSTPIVAYNGTATLKAHISGLDVTGVTYQWYDDSGDEPVPIEDATSDTLTVENVTGISYLKCEATDRFGSKDWFYATVGVENHLVGTVDSYDVYAAPGEDAVLTVHVSADDMTGITVTWRDYTYDDEITVEGTLDEDDCTSYTVENVQGRCYVECEITDRFGNTAKGRRQWDEWIYFNVYADTGLSVEPGASGLNVHVPYGGNVTITPSVSIDQGFDYDYSWYIEADDYSAEGLTATVPDVTYRTYAYFQVWDEYGNWENAEYTIDVENGFTVSPVGATELTVPRGGNTTLAVTASADEGEFEYAWGIKYSEEWEEPRGIQDEPGEHFWIDYFDGAFGSVFTTGAIDEDTVFVCTVTDDFGEQINVEFTVTVTDGPVILYQPVNYYAFEEEEYAIFEFRASNSFDWDDNDGLSYVWQVSADGGDTWYDVDDSDQDWIEIEIDETALSLIFRCVVTNENGETATRTVRILDEQEPMLRMREPLYEYDEDTGEVFVVTDVNGDPVYNDEADTYELTLSPGIGWGAELWYGSHRITAEEFRSGDLCLEDESGAVTLHANDDDTFVVMAHDFLRAECTFIAYTNTNLEGGSSMPVYVSLPGVGAYLEHEVSEENLIYGDNLPEVTDDGARFYIIANGENGIVTDVRLSEQFDWLDWALFWGPGVSENEIWYVSLDPDIPFTPYLTFFVDWTDGDGVDHYDDYVFVRLSYEPRTSLLWQWADREWDNELERDIFVPREDDYCYDGMDVYPGQEMTGRFVLETVSGTTRRIAPVDLYDVFPVEGEISFMTLTEEHDGCVSFFIEYFDGVLLGYNYDEDEETATFWINSDLPDIGWYDDLVTVETDQGSEVVPLYRDWWLTDNEDYYEYRDLWAENHAAKWIFTGENRTIYLVASDGAVITDIYEHNSDIGVTFTPAYDVYEIPVSEEEEPRGLSDEPEEEPEPIGSSYIAVTLTGEHPAGDYLDVLISGYWGDGTAFEDHGRGIRIVDATPGLVFRYTGWDGERPFIDEAWGYETRMDAAPGDDRTIELYLRQPTLVPVLSDEPVLSDGDLILDAPDYTPDAVELEYIPLDPECITVEGPARLELVSGGYRINSDEEEPEYIDLEPRAVTRDPFIADDEPYEDEVYFLRIVFTDFGPVTLSYTDWGDINDDDDDIIYEFAINCALPEFGFYTEDILENGELIDEEDTEAWQEAFIKNFDNTIIGETVILAARNDSLISNAFNDCDADLTITRPTQAPSAYASVTVNSLNDDKIRIRTFGYREDGSDFEEYPEVRRDPFGLVVCFTDWDGDVPYIDYENFHVDNRFSAEPGSDRTVAVYLYTLNEDGNPVYIDVDPSEIESDGPIELEVVQGADEDTAFLRVTFTGFGPAYLTWEDEDGKTWTFLCAGELPEIGFYESAIFDEHYDLPEDENDWIEYYVGDLLFDGTDDMLVIAARGDIRILSLENSCDSSLSFPPANAFPEGGAPYVPVFINRIVGDRIGVNVTYTRPEWDGDTDERYIEITVTNKAPGLVARFTDFDNGIPFIDDEEEDPGYTDMIDAEPGSDRTVAVYFRTFDQNGDPVYTPVNADDLYLAFTGGNADVADKETQEGVGGTAYLKVFFNDFGSFGIGWDYDNGTPDDYTDDVVYILPCRATLPGIGFYRAELLEYLDEDGSLPDDDDPIWAETFLSEWELDEESEYIVIAARGDAVIYTVEPDCDSYIDFYPSADDMPEDGVEYVELYLFDDLRSDRISVRVTGDWGGNNTFDDHRMGIDVRDVRDGIGFRYLRWSEDGSYSFIDTTERLERAIYATPGQEMTVRFFLLEDGVESNIDQEDIRFEGSVDVEYEQSTDCLRIRFTATGGSAFYYEDEDEDDYELYAYVDLPDIGFYTADVVDPTTGEYIDASQVLEAAYVTEIEYYGEPVTVYLAVNGWLRINEVENDCGNLVSGGDIEPNGLYVPITLERLIGDDRLRVRVSAEWGDGGAYSATVEARIIDMREQRDTQLNVSPVGDTSVTVDPGDDVTLAVTATADLPQGSSLFYLWLELNNPDVDGGDPWNAKRVVDYGNNNSITLEDVQNAGRYMCNVLDDFGNSRQVVFFVNVENGFSISPVLPSADYDEDDVIEILPGQEVTLEALATVAQGGSFRYQWYRTHYDRYDERLVGATGASLIVDESDIYECRAIDNLGNVISLRFHVEVRNGFDVYGYTPSPVYVTEGDSVTLSAGTVTAVDPEGISYQWLDADRREISGAVKSYLAVDGGSDGDVDRYYCEIHDAYNNYWTVGYTVKTVAGEIKLVTNQAELLLALASEDPVSVISISGNFTVDEDCSVLLDEDHYANFCGVEVVITQGSTITVDEGGVLGIAWYSYDWDTMHDQYPEPWATFTNYGTIVVNGGGAVEGEFTLNGGVVGVYDGGFCVMPGENYGGIAVYGGGALRTSQGRECYNYGAILISDGAEMEARFGSRVTNCGDGCIQLDGVFRIGCVNYPEPWQDPATGETVLVNTDHIWFDNFGEIYGHGDIILVDIGGMDMDQAIEDVMGMLGQDHRFPADDTPEEQALWYDISIYRELTVDNEADLAAAFPGNRVVAGEQVPGDMDTIVRIYDEENGYPVYLGLTLMDDICTMGKIVIPESTNVEIGEGVRLEAGVENEGVIIVDEGATLSTTQGGDIVNRGTIMIGEGATLLCTMGSSLRNEGESACIDLDGEIRVGCIRHPDDDGVTRDHAWISGGGTFEGSGTVILEDLGAAHGNDPIADMPALIAYVEGIVDNDSITVRAEGGTAPVPVLAITTQPADFYGASGDTITIPVVATGEGLEYTWYYKNAGTSSFKLSSVTGSTYTATLSSKTDGRQVYCVITDATGNTVTSETATIHIGTAPTEPEEPEHTPLAITTQPADATVEAGETATFTVEVTPADAVITWQYSTNGGETWTDFPAGMGEHVTSLSIQASANINGHKIRCIVSYNGANLTSNAATLTVTGTQQPAALQIVTQPADFYGASGDTITIPVVATGEGLEYTWYYKNAGTSSFKLSSVTGSTYTATLSSKTDGRQVYVVITDATGATVTSETATIHIGTAPTEPEEPEPTELAITTQPADFYGASGDTITIPVVATGDGLEYTWYIKNAGASSFKTSTVTGSTYTATLSSKTDGRQVYVVITDAYGATVTSETATIHIGTAPGEPEQPEPTELAITTQPADAYGAAGETVTVSVEATGDGLTYVWYYKNAGASSFTASTISGSEYSIELTSKKDGRQVYVVITDAYGATVTSDTATVHIGTAPTEPEEPEQTPLAITTQPADAYGASGETVTVSVEATGDGLTYVWYYKNAGASSFTASSITGSEYSIELTSKKDGRQVYVVITDAYGASVTSDIATVHIGTAPTEPEEPEHTPLAITTQPADFYGASGDTITIPVVATGDGLTYAWYYKNAGASSFKLSTVTGSTYTATLSSKNDGREVYVVITDAYGATVTSDSAMIHIGTAPGEPEEPEEPEQTPLAITTQPADAYGASGETVTVSVEATGDGLTYVWYYKNAGASSFTASTISGNEYSIELTSKKDGRQVYVVITDAYGATVTSDIATVHIGTAPEEPEAPSLAIVTQPADAYGASGETVTVSVEATGEGLEYVWYYKNRNDSEFTASSITGSEYSIALTAKKDGRQVYVVITDATGATVTSDIATVHIGTAPEN